MWLDQFIFKVKESTKLLTGMQKGCGGDKARAGEERSSIKKKEAGAARGGRRFRGWSERVRC